MRLECFGSGGAWLTEGFPWGNTTHRAPTIVLALPNDSAPAVGSILPVVGWTWGNTDSLRQVKFWIDGEVAQGNHVNTGIYSPEACGQMGLDPGTCNPNGGFQGYIDVSYLSPGRHHLQIVATDNYEDPMPNFLEVEFVVPSGTPNQAPIAVNDLVSTSNTIGHTHPVEIHVAANDHDPEGWPLQLPGNPFVTLPTKGNVRRLGEGTIQYTPMPNSTGVDSFQYKIEDSFGVTATATVTVQIMEVIYLP
jgi:hypothetical protein